MRVNRMGFHHDLPVQPSLLIKIFNLGLYSTIFFVLHPSEKNYLSLFGLAFHTFYKIIFFDVISFMGFQYKETSKSIYSTSIY
jgi:hypothetical protein